MEVKIIRALFGVDVGVMVTMWRSKSSVQALWGGGGGGGGGGRYRDMWRSKLL